MNDVGKFFLYAGIAILAVVGGFQSYWNHQYTEDRFSKVEELLTNSKARPDPWTGTDDNERTMMLCAAIMVLATEHDYSSDVYHLLPDVCK